MLHANCVQLGTKHYRHDVQVSFHNFQLAGAISKLDARVYMIRYTEHGA